MNTEESSNPASLLLCLKLLCIEEPSNPHLL
ncbi:hypothetical protein KGM_212236A, partial [Danaus plexippus plexippus]